MIRAATPADFDALLVLNEESVRFLSPLDLARLQRLHRLSAYHKVVDEGGIVAAFLLAFREDAGYESPNYAWFVDRHPTFVYIDRIVTSASFRGRGHAALLYDDIAAFAADQGVSLLTCEIDLTPPNPGSIAFHRRMGFAEVGRQWLRGTGKQVSMQSKTLADARLP